MYRHTADADQVPDDEDKRTRDWVWYDSGDLPGSAAQLPTTGLLSTPVRATIADAFFSSFGGNAPESLNGCDTDFEECTQENEWRQSLLQQDYTFFVPAPSAPDSHPEIGSHLMVWEYEDRCSTVPSSPANPPGDDIDELGEADLLTDTTAALIGDPSCTIEHEIVEGVDDNDHPGIWVTVLATQASYPNNNYIAFAGRYKVAWDFVPPNNERGREFQVNFNTLQVVDDSEPCGEDGEWVMSLRANEAWIHPVEGSGDGGAPSGPTGPSMTRPQRVSVTEHSRNTISASK